MMVYVSITCNKHLRQHGAFFVFSVLVLMEFRRNSTAFPASQSPAGAPTALCRRQPESVIVGNTLPTEASVSPAPVLKEVTLYFQG